jgi:hypothetical protein
MMTNSVSPISATARAWANANSLASEKSDGWKIDLTKGIAGCLLIVLTPFADIAGAHFATPVKPFVVT